jgi:hypothetical protein
VAFRDYLGLFAPGIKLIIKFTKDLEAAKGDDGMISTDEWAECIGTLVTGLLEVAEPHIRKD